MALNSKSAPPQPPSPKHEFEQQKHDGKNILIISVSCDCDQNILAVVYLEFVPRWKG
jgi:hypothetical protein